MTLTKEEITLLRPLDKTSLDRAMLSLAKAMEETKDENLFNRYADLILKLDRMTDEEFGGIDFTAKGGEDERTGEKENREEALWNTPAGPERLAAAMEAAGYTLDPLESTGDYLRFYGNYGELMTMESWRECEDWLNGVVFDDLPISDRVERLLHPERFSPYDLQKAAMRTLEDALEQNDNQLDGIINNIAASEYPEEESRKAREQENMEKDRRSVFQDLKESRKQAARAFAMGKETARQRPGKERGILLRV